MPLAMRRLDTCTLVPLLAAILASLAGETAARQRSAPPGYPRTDTRYYVIYSRLEGDTLREAAARLTAMAREYHRRTSGFARTVDRRLAVYLFDNLDDYHRAGGLQGSAGIYAGSALLAVVPRQQAWAGWATVQHEGFHQFADQSVGGRWPVWLNEGMAEYFAAAVWTGDTFVTGLIHPLALLRLQATLKANRAKPFLGFARMDQAAWNAQLSSEQYAQAWAMVHFLAHAHDAKYRAALGDLIRDASRSRRGDEALLAQFGRRIGKLEADWRAWWLAQRSDATAHLYNKAAVATLTSFLARAHIQGLRFGSIDEFFAAGRAGRIDVAPKGYAALWLPDRLLKQEILCAPRRGTWQLLPGRYPRLQLKSLRGRTFTGSFQPSGSRRPKIAVSVAGE